MSPSYSLIMMKYFCIFFIFVSLMSSCKSGFNGEASQLEHGPVDEELVDCCNIVKTEDCANLSLSCDCESLVALNDSKFEYLDGDTVLFNGLTLEVQLNTSQGLPVVCNISQNGTVSGDLFPDYPVGFDIITYACASLSIIGCSLVFVTFFLFKDLRTFPAKIVVHIAITILVANVLHIISIGESKSSELCDTVAILLHFFILAQFSWMTVMCFEVCHSFYLASQLIPVRVESTRYKLLAYCIVAWTIPLLIVAVSVIVNYTTPLVRYGVNHKWKEGICWINHSLSGLVAFIVPVCVFVLLQLVLFAATGFYFVKSSKNKNRSDGNGEKNTPYLRVLLAMFSASNLVWILGVIAFAVNTSWVWYPFLVLGSIQGFILFLGFYGTRKVLKLYISKFS